MEILLLSDVTGIGKRMEVRTVSDGHARNFLFPRRLAVAAADPRARTLRRAWEARGARENAAREAARAAISSLSLEFPVRTGPGGVVFGSVAAAQIEIALRARSLAFDRVVLERPLKTLGRHAVSVRLSGGETIQLIVSLAPQE